MQRTLLLIVMLILAGAVDATAAEKVVRKLLDKPLDCHFEMGTKRRNWTHAKWKVVSLGVGMDLSRANALRLQVATRLPRDEVGVTVAVREADGTWYSHPWAANLVLAENEGVAYFTDFETPDYHNPPGGSFRDENGLLDLNNINAIAVGVVNPLGVNEVDFTVESISAVAIPRPEPQPVTIEVTGKALDVNGQRMIPAGVFGSFNLKSIPTGESPYLELDGKRHPVKDGKVEVDGKAYEVKKGRVQIGRTRHKVTTPSIPRVKRYRLASDRRINHGGYQDAPIYGDEITHIMINSVGDRTAYSRRLTDKDWEDNYRRTGAFFGKAVKADGRTAYVEFWNEPYLNWANINRKNFDPKLYDVSKAHEEGPVHLKIDGTVMPHMRWTQNFGAPVWNWCGSMQEWRRGKDDKGRWTLPYAMPYHNWYPGKWPAECAKLNPPDSVQDGEKYTAGDGKTYTAFTPWYPYDPTQFTYWSGQGMLKPYIDPMLVYFKAIKEEAGDKALTIAGWGNRPSEDHWAGFHQLYKPTIDAGVQYIDAINDHDYGGQPTNLPASYEVVHAYAKTKYGKSLTFYNTECASSSDPQVHGDSATTSVDLAKFTWVTRKIVHALDYVPDKAHNFAHFGVGGGFWSDEGEGVAMDLLRNVRGRMMHVVNPDPGIYAVACVDGTDPQNPRPDNMSQEDELVVVLLNDHKTPREVNLVVRPMQITQFTGAVERYIDTPEGKPSLRERKVAVEPEALRISATLQPFEVRTWTISLIKLPAVMKPEKPVMRRQFHGPAILEQVTPAQPAKQLVKVDEASRSGAKRAWIKIVTERLAEGEGTVHFNDTAITLPRAPTPENAARVVRIPVDVADLKALNTLIFSAKRGHAGYLLGMCSLVVEYE